MAKTTVLRLTGPQMERLVNAIANAYDEAGLAMMLLYRLDKKLAFFGGRNIPEKVFDIVTKSQMEGWTNRLIVAARAANPDNPDLLAFEESLSLTPVQQPDRPQLEKIVRDLSNFVDVAQFRARLGGIETWVCAIEHPRGFGTGFLVGPDLVLTNYHVVEPLLKHEVGAQSVRCRFDFKALPGAAAVINPGRPVGLADSWQVALSPYSNFDLTDAPPDPTQDELDYAVIRLAERVGGEPVGDPAKAEPGAPKRGWLTLASNAPHVAATEDLLVLQHPQDLAAAQARPMPMQLAFGTVMGFAGADRRVRHDTKTLPGSSGSPCFNADLDLVALHHAGDPKSLLQYKGEFNQAIPIGLVVDHLKRSQAEPFWDVAPG